MEVIEGPLQTETLPDTPQDPSQPPAFQPEPKLLDREAEVKAAIDAAEKKGDDFLSVKIGDLGTSQSPQNAPTEVPEKFKTPTGEVDVEKLKASTRQLDEAIEKKEAAVEKTVDDYLQAYREKEAKLRNMPNPDKLAEGLKTAPPPPPPHFPSGPPVPEDQAMAQLNADFQRDPLGTLGRLTDIMVERRLAEKLAPVEQDISQTRKEREDNRIRQNLKEIAAKDPRVMAPTVFAAINAKLDSDPDYWKLKNPHKAAWLEVKEEMRLGEFSQTPAQPSRLPSPILGGGTPPPPQSSASSGPLNYQVLTSALGQVGKDPKQMEALEKAMKEFADKEFRSGR